MSLPKLAQIVWPSTVMILSDHLTIDSQKIIASKAQE